MTEDLYPLPGCLTTTFNLTTRHALFTILVLYIAGCLSKHAAG
jgi:hypothetical protein